MKKSQLNKLIREIVENDPMSGDLWKGKYRKNILENIKSMKTLLKNVKSDVKWIEKKGEGFDMPLTSLGHLLEELKELVLENDKSSFSSKHK